LKRSDGQIGKRRISPQRSQRSAESGEKEKCRIGRFIPLTARNEAEVGSRQSQKQISPSAMKRFSGEERRSK
jgi:hypothetical protein